MPSELSASLFLPVRAHVLMESEKSGKPLTFVDAEAIASSSAGPSRKESLPSMEEQKEMAPFLSMLEDVLKRESSPPLVRWADGSGE